jgi:hypothetical protein
MRSGPCLCGDPACPNCGTGLGELDDDTEIVAVFPDEDRSETMFYGDLPDGYEWEETTEIGADGHEFTAIKKLSIGKELCETRGHHEWIKDELKSVFCRDCKERLNA